MSNIAFSGLTVKRTMALSAYKFETLNVTEPSEFVYHVELNRPDKRNAMDKTFWRYSRNTTVTLFAVNLELLKVMQFSVHKLFCSFAEKLLLVRGLFHN